MIEVDPDFWLATRLARGSGLQRVLNYASYPVLIAVWMVLRRVDPSPYAPWSSFEPGQLLGLVMFAPILIPLRLADYDRRGLLDVIRLGGRNPKRVLIGFLGGLMAPLIWIVPVLLVFRIWIDRPQGDLSGGLLVAAGALELELITLGVLTFPVREFVMAGIAVVGAGAAVGLSFAIGGLAYALSLSVKLVAAAIVVFVAPFAISCASHALARPAQPKIAREADRRSWWFGYSLSGPPELLRRLSATVKPAVICAGVGVVALGAVKMAAAKQVGHLPAGAFGFDASLVVVISVLICAALIVSTITSEVASGAVDLVRLTPQTAESIAVGWYVGSVGPFFLASAALAAIAAALIPESRVTPIGAAVAAAILSATFLAEGLSSNLNGLATRYIAPAFVAMMGVRPGIPLVVTPPWHLRPFVVAPAIAIAIAIGATAGRVRRPHGPALAGLAAAAGLAGIALLARLVPAFNYPRAVVPIVCAFATWASLEQPEPSSPWSRVAFTVVGASLGVALMSVDAGFGLTASLTAAVAAALAALVGVLTYELVYRYWFVAAAVPVAIAGVLLRGSVRATSIQPVEIAGLGILAAAVAAAHSLMRRRAARNGVIAS